VTDNSEDAMPEILLNRGFAAKVDDCDYDELRLKKWFANNSGKNHYAYRATTNRYKRVTVWMHRMVYELHHGAIPEGLCIDHINRDTLDNRLSNLRLVTHQQNMTNKGAVPGSRSGFKGVAWHPHNKKWQSNISAEVDGKRKQRCLGYFYREMDAARAYDRAFVLLHGTPIGVNFPDEWPDVSALSDSRR
jgi:hypothetical protein